MESLFQHHGSHNLHAVPFALSNVSGAASLYCSSGQPDGHDRLHEWDFGNKSSSLLAPDREKISAQWKWLQFESELTVQTTTIHSFCAEHNIPTIDYIHLDVQGAELLALEGAGSLIDTVTAIWLEVSDVRFYKNQPVRPEVYSFLRTRNFTMVYQSDDDVQPNQLFVRDSVLSTRKIDLGHRIQDEGRDAARTTPSTLLCKLRKIASIASLFRGKTGSEISERGA
jgi:FkbM family methyltransferase